MPRTPDEILSDFGAGMRGQTDVDMFGLLHEVIEDIRSSYRLAMEDEESPGWIAYVEGVVDDYVTNHYGEIGVECKFCNGDHDCDSFPNGHCDECGGQIIYVDPALPRVCEDHPGEHDPYSDDHENGGDPTLLVIYADLDDESPHEPGVYTDDGDDYYGERA